MECAILRNSLFYGVAILLKQVVEINNFSARELG